MNCEVCGVCGAGMLNVRWEEFGNRDMLVCFACLEAYRLAKLRVALTPPVESESVTHTHVWQDFGARPIG